MVGADSANEVASQCVYDLIAPEYRDAYREFNRRICQGEKGSMEFDIIGLKGVRRNMETHAAPLRQPDGALAQLALTRDVTEKRRRDRARDLLGAIVDSSEDAIVSKDLNGIITTWNKSAELMFGYTATEAIGKSITMLVPAERLDEERTILRRIRNGERTEHFETIRRRKDGTLLDVSMTISPVRDSSGRAVGASNIARDITDRRRTEKAIHDLNSQLTQELSAMRRMQQLSTRLVQADDFNALLGDIVDAAIEITGADRGKIQLPEEGSLLQHASEAGQRVVTGTHQCTPLISRSGQVVGLFSTWYNESHQPAERELRLLDVLARQAADLIERKNAVEALLSSESRFRQLSNTMPQFVWTARPDGFVDYYNERWYDFTGFDRNEFGRCQLE